MDGAGHVPQRAVPDSARHRDPEEPSFQDMDIRQGLKHSALRVFPLGQGLWKPSRRPAHQLDPSSVVALHVDIRVGA